MLTLLASDRALEALDAFRGFEVPDSDGFEAGVWANVDLGGSTNVGFGVSAGLETGLDTG